MIHPGVAEQFFVVTDAEAAAVRSRFQVQKPYILFVGCIEPRKNVGALIAAYRQLPVSVRRDTELVMAGPIGWIQDEERETLLQSGEGVRYLGYVPESDLAGLFRGAAVVAYPSLYEGFGLPAAQAMACGVPVVSSNSSCLPEVIGDGGLLVDPTFAEELSHSLESILTSADLARELGSRGRELATNYRWSISAQKSLDFFHEVCGK